MNNLKSLVIRTCCKWIILLVVSVGFTACGYKGPPLPPIDEPSPPQKLSKDRLQ